MKSELVKAAENVGSPSDPLTQKIRESILGVDKLRQENLGLTAQVERLQSDKAVLESKLASATMQLEQERAERRHYHSLATEVLTRLDIVGQTIHDVVKRAEHEVYRQRKEHPRADIPPLRIPEALEKFFSGNGRDIEAEEVA